IKLGEPQVARRYTPKLSSYELFLQARFYFQKWNPESLPKGREYLEQAIAADPEFCLAHVELGWCLFAHVTENLISAGEGAALMSASARKALQIDPSLAEAHAVLAMVAVISYSWTEAARQFKLAMSREPVSAFVRYFYCWYLGTVGREAEAQREIEGALLDDPLNLLFHAIPRMYLIGTGKRVEAEAKLRYVIELDPNFWLAYLWLGCDRMAHGLIPEALPLAEKAYSLAPSNCTAGLL